MQSKMEEVGYSFHNPDTGWEWHIDHPIESGMVDDATDIERMTLKQFHKEYGFSSNIEEFVWLAQQQYVPLEASIPRYKLEKSK